MRDPGNEVDHAAGDFGFLFEDTSVGEITWLSERHRRRFANQQTLTTAGYLRKCRRLTGTITVFDGKII